MGRIFLCYFCLIGSVFADISDLDLIPENLDIVDGDSIGMQMRFKGIDTPELSQECQKTATSKVISCGYLSKNYLQKLIFKLPGKLRIKPLGFGYYKRVLVSVTKGDIDIGKKMVEDGYAFSYKDTYLTEETTAKQQKRGFWSFHRPPQPPSTYRKTH